MTIQHRPNDAVDLVVGLAPGTPLFDLRAKRPEFVEGAEACRAAVLDPTDSLGLTPDLRRAIAARVGIRSGRPDLLPDEIPPTRDPDMVTLATGGLPKTSQLAAIARHADMIATDPGQSSATDLQQLQAAGLSTSQIVALSELLAYACFHIRIAHGLSLLKDPV